MMLLLKLIAPRYSSTYMIHKALLVNPLGQWHTLHTARTQIQGLRDRQVGIPGNGAKGTRLMTFNDATRFYKAPSV